MKPAIGILSKDSVKSKGREKSIANSAQSSIVKKKSIVKMKPDIGILSKDFLKNKGREQPVDKKFPIHRKKLVSAADVDVGILRKRTIDTNLDDMNEARGRSLQLESLKIPIMMCPDKDGRGGYFHMLNATDDYLPKCSCPSPTTCGPDLCECLEYADGDILQCMDPLNQLCQGSKYIDGIPGPWSMEECLGEQYGRLRAMVYCSFFSCVVDGGSERQCLCNVADSFCTVYKEAQSCASSKCCQAQTDDEGREACLWDGKLWENYYDQVTSLYISGQEMVSRFNECSFNSENDKSIVECYCESFTYRQCVNFGIAFPVYCEAMNCCWEQTEDGARLDCFTTQFRSEYTGSGFYFNRDTMKESCIASGKSSDQCKCDIHGLSNCVGNDYYNREPNCDLFQCCQSETEDNDDGRKDCLVQDDAQSRYNKCINYGNSTESCVCDKSNTLCSSGHSNDRHCELSSCCQNQKDGAGRKECIGNFATSQPPSSAPSETTLAEDTGDDGASPTAASTLPGTSSAFVSTPFGSKSLIKTTSKMLAVTAAVIGWLLCS